MGVLPAWVLRLRGAARGARSAVWLLAALLVACSGEVETPGEALRVFGNTLPEAYVNEAYDAPVRAVGGLRPYTFELTRGSLPPGITLEGGVLRGAPSETGTYSFTVSVSDANLSRTFQEYTLRVTEPPPPRLVVEAPATEVRAPVTLRVSVEDARALRALRTRISWDGGRFELVPGSVRAAGSALAVFSESGPGWLQLDLAALAAVIDGTRRVVTFQLAPRAPAPLRLDTATEFLQATGATFEEAVAGNRSVRAGAASAGPGGAGSEGGAPGGGGDTTGGEGAPGEQGGAGGGAEDRTEPAPGPEAGEADGSASDELPGGEQTEEQMEEAQDQEGAE